MSEDRDGTKTIPQVPVGLGQQERGEARDQAQVEGDEESAADVAQGAAGPSAARQTMMPVAVRPKVMANASAPRT